jgi:hypothetical protein
MEHSSACHGLLDCPRRSPHDRLILSRKPSFPEARCLSRRFDPLPGAQLRLSSPNGLHHFFAASGNFTSLRHLRALKLMRPSKTTGLVFSCK